MAALQQERLLAAVRGFVVLSPLREAPGTEELKRLLLEDQAGDGCRSGNRHAGSLHPQPADEDLANGDVGVVVATAQRSSGCFPG